MKQLKSDSGNIADIIAETDAFYWAQYADPGDRTLVPFTIAKDNTRWEPYTPAPEVGDVWAVGVDGSRYRVIGIDEKRGLWHICLADGWHNGEYPKPSDGIQVDPSAKPASVFTRTFPDASLSLDWILIERPGT